MRIVVLAAPDSWYLRDLRRAAAGRLDLHCAAFSEIRSEIDAAGRCTIASGEIELTGADAVLVRTMPPGTLEQVVFRMDALARVELAGTAVLNPPRAVEVAVDKYLTTARLTTAGLASPRTEVCQTCDDALAAFARLGGDVVVKPLFGGEGRGIMRVEDESLAMRVFRTLEQLGAVIYVQEFIRHEGYDLRVLLIGERAFAMRRRNPRDWRTNVSRGAIAERLEATGELIEMARRAAAAIGAPIAGVDLLPAADGRVFVLEVNAVPGWQALARTLEVDIAAEVLAYAAAAVGRRKSTR
jgi:RimK family alpha-L-glutamate ligase